MREGSIDAAKVLDAVKSDPSNGYYDPRDPYTTVPRRSTVLAGGLRRSRRIFSAGRVQLKEPSPAGGIGIVRESMLVRPASNSSEVPITTAAAAEIRTVLGEHLGATLVESADPLWTPDPSCEPMRDQLPTQALCAAGAGVHARASYSGLRDGRSAPVRRDFAAAIRPDRVPARP